MWHKRFSMDEVPEYIEGKTDYSPKELDLMAEALLREDARKEKCRTCEQDDQYGEKTGHFVVKEQFDKEGNPVLDEAGNQLKVIFPEYRCAEGHKWFKGEGKAKGIGGKNPILFEEHIKQRNRREIMNATGIPDPAIVEGLYTRSHPQGRRVNSEADRRSKRLGFYS